MVAFIIEHKHRRDRAFRPCRSDYQPVDRRTGLVFSEPHPDLPAKSEAAHCGPLFEDFADQGSGSLGHASVHLALEDLQDLVPAAGPVLSSPDLCAVCEDKGILKSVGPDLALVVIDALGRHRQRQDHGRKYEK